MLQKFQIEVSQFGNFSAVKEIFMHNDEMANYCSPTCFWGDRIPLYDRYDAIRLLDILLSKQIGVLGVEGFRIFDDRIQPDMDFIVDCSDSLLNNPNEFVRVSINGIRLFLSNAPEDMVFEFTISKM